MRLPVSLLAASLLAAPVLSHDPGLSAASVRAGATAIEVDVSLSNADAAGALPADLDGDGAISAAELHRARGELQAYFAAHPVLTIGDAIPELVSAAFAIGDERDVVCRLRYARAEDGALTYSAPLLETLPRGHRQYAAIYDGAGGRRAEAVLHRGHPGLRASLDGGTDASRNAGAFAFAVLGVEHILIGYDHILFLLALLLATPSLRSALLVITTFTVAHSATLAVATLDLVRLPGSLVEAVIAASILWVAADNLRRRGSGARLGVTFGFGLVHGFGFASVLRDLGIAEAGGVVLPLLSFNAGVELGQLAIAALALPILHRLARRPTFRSRILPAASCTVGAIGAWWLLERTLLG